MSKQKEIKTLNEEGRITEGYIKGGDVFRTSSGRVTTPFPKQKSEVFATIWTIENGLLEAKARNDRYMELQFLAMNPKNFTKSDIDTSNYYLFGSFSSK